MSFENDLWKDDQWAMPQRIGPDVGGAQEFAMQSVAGGYQGIKTVEFVNHDGSITTLRNRNGWPEFETSELPRPEENFAVLYCRMMSDAFPLGADVTPGGGGYATQNAPLSWPTYPTSMGRIGGGVTEYLGTRAELATDYPDSPGNSTWYDTRTGGARQFTDVLSWSNCMSENLSEGPYATSGPLSGYYASHATDYPGFSVGTTLHYSPSGYKSHVFGAYLPAHAINRGTRDYRYVPDPDGSVRLYKNGKKLPIVVPITALMLAACMVLVGEETRYQIIRLKEYALFLTGSPIDMGLVIDVFDEEGLLLSSTNVTLPAGLKIRNIPVAPRWNASGTEAACSVEHLASAVNEHGVSVLSTDILLIASDGSSAIGPSYGSHDFGDSAAPGIKKSNKPMAIDYIGDDLKVLRREEAILVLGTTNSSTDTTTTLVWHSWTGQTNTFDCQEFFTNFEHLSERVSNASSSSTISTQLVLEPGGTVIYSAQGTSASSSYSTSSYGGFDEQEVAPGTYGCGPSTGSWYATDVSVTQGRSDTITGETIVSVLADLRKNMVFVFATEGSSTNIGEGTANATGYSSTVNVSYNDAYSQSVTGRLKLIASGATTLKTFDDIYQNSGNTARSVQASTGTSPKYVAPTPPTPPITPVSNSRSGFGNAGGSGGIGTRNRYAINSPYSFIENFAVPVYFSANVSEDGRVAVASCAVFKLAASTLANFSSTNKLLTKGATGPWNVAEFSLPTYDGTVKWVGEPLILTGQT